MLSALDVIETLTSGRFPQFCRMLGKHVGMSFVPASHVSAWLATQVQISKLEMNRQFLTRRCVFCAGATNAGESVCTGPGGAFLNLPWALSPGMVCFDIACQVDSTMAWYPPINIQKDVVFTHPPFADHVPRNMSLVFRICVSLP